MDLMVARASSLARLSKEDSTSDFFVYNIDFEFMQELTQHLRAIAHHPLLQGKTLFIPDGCEYVGFLEGYYQLPEFLQFIADMLEP